jgi:aminopeptidase N
MTFRVAKGITAVATGDRVSETTVGDIAVTVWKTSVPITVAGFNVGAFKMDEGHIEKPPMEVASYANTADSDWVTSVKQGGSSVLGQMSTTSLNKKSLSEAQYSLVVFSDYFGVLPYKHLAMTQQTADNFGQSWPMLVYLPLSYLVDETARHFLGYPDWSNYFNVVAPHEVAHQWWGHDVGFNSYRDQWMSEGFAEESASL